MEFLIILAIINTTLFVVLFSYLLKIKVFSFSLPNNLTTIKASSNTLNNQKSILVLITYYLFLILPLFWGLGFLLNSDANVVVVLFTIAWIYNWIKYTYFYPEE
jgi:hypothetical protein